MTPAVEGGLIGQLAVGYHTIGLIGEIVGAVTAVDVEDGFAVDADVFASDPYVSAIALRAFADVAGIPVIESCTWAEE